MLSRNWPRPTARAPVCTGWSSGAAGTTPATGWTTSRPSSSWPVSGRTSAPNCATGCATMSRASARRLRGRLCRPSTATPRRSPAAAGTDRMKPVDEHVADCLAAVGLTAPVDVPVLDALDLVLAEDVVSPVALPVFDNSAMDGYAIRVPDVAAAS